MACRKHIKRLPKKDDDEVLFIWSHPKPPVCRQTFVVSCQLCNLTAQNADRLADILPLQFVPLIVYETTMKLEKMPLEPEYQKIPEYFLPLEIKKVPVFEVFHPLIPAMYRL